MQNLSQLHVPLYLNVVVPLNKTIKIKWGQHHFSICHAYDTNYGSFFDLDLTELKNKARKITLLQSYSGASTITQNTQLRMFFSQSNFV